LGALGERLPEIRNDLRATPYIADIFLRFRHFLERIGIGNLCRVREQKASFFDTRCFLDAARPMPVRLGPVAPYQRSANLSNERLVRRG
jgi:hypothetical protein